MKWFTSSLRIKFFLMAFVLALGTIGTMSFLQSRVLTQLLESNFRSTSIETSEKIGGEIEAVFQRWALSTVYLLQGIYSLPEAQANDELKRLIDVEKDFFAGNVFIEEAGAFKAVSAYAKAEAPAADDRQTQAQGWLEKVRKKAPDRLFHIDIGGTRKTLRLARGLPVEGGTGKLSWIVLEASKSPILEQMNLQEGMKATLLTESSQDFVEGKAVSADLKRVLKKQNFDDILKYDLGSGFFGSFVDAKKIAWQGSYFKMPLSGLVLILQQREDILFAPLKYQLIQTGKWAALILLLAVLFTFFSAEALIARLEKVNVATHSIARGQFATRLNVQGNDEIRQLAESVNAMAGKLTSLVSHEKDMVRLEHELNVANEVQSSFIPSEFSQEGALVLASTYRSASECGGDFWGHYVIAPNTHLVLVGDATGHGVPAALVTAIAYATSHLCSQLSAAGAQAQISPAVVLSLLNRALYDSLKGKLCMTFFAAIINTADNTVVYSNGGHPFPLIVPKKSDDARLTAKKKPKPYIVMSDIKKNGQPLGFDPNSTYHNVELAFMPGDRLVMYTDGIVECHNQEQKQWGLRALEKSVQKNQTREASSFRDGIMSDMEDFRRETPLPDDATLIVISSDFKGAA